MDNYISFGVALTFLSAAIIYVTIKNRERNQQRDYKQIDNQQIDIELIIYKKEKDRLEERLRKKELSWENFVRLRIYLDEQHKKNMEQICRSRVK
ncbi:MAG: hypothetical protein MUO82_06025 [Candidatus Thermoplasmatota archaeon]|nr:hypothetical protein [Candidatus Thermoplasmatota archaeon]